MTLKGIYIRETVHIQTYWNKTFCIETNWNETYRNKTYWLQNLLTTKPIAYKAYQI